MSTVIDNVKRSKYISDSVYSIESVTDSLANLVIPGGSELIGMWGGEWDLKRVYTSFHSHTETDAEISI